MKKLPVAGCQLPVDRRAAQLPNCGTDHAEPFNVCVEVSLAPQGRPASAQHEVLGSGARPETVPQGRLDSRLATGNRQLATAMRHVQRVAKLLRATAKEIFDENAYARFLSRHALAPSRSSYLAFLEENCAARERRPRCC